MTSSLRRAMREGDGTPTPRPARGSRLIPPSLGWIRALPTLLRVGFSGALAYRAEFIVWVFAYSMPLIMLALWTAVAREAPVGRFGEREFRAYFLATLVVRLVTGSWLVWELTMEIRQGALSGRLLRPIHPLLAYATENLGALPMRLAMTVPIALAAIAWVGPGALTHDPVQAAILPLALVGAWAITFCVMACIGSLAFFWESALSVFDVWLAVYSVLSGYIMPLELFPPWARDVLAWLPFRSMLSFPVETALGLLDRQASLRALGVQWMWVAIFLVLALRSWRAGVRRFQAFGG